MGDRRPRRLAPLSALATALVLAACSGSPTPETSPATTAGSASPTGSDTARGEWALGLDSRPTRGIAGDGLAYVTTSGGGKFPPQLYAVDATSGELLAHRSASGLPYGLAVAADGALWVAGTRHSDQPTGGGVRRYDGTSLLAAGEADVPGVALTLAAVGDELWVGSENAVFVVDPHTLSVVRTVPVQGSVNQLLPLPDGAGVVAVTADGAGAAGIAILDAAGATVRRVDVEAAGSIVVAAAESVLWVRTPVETDSVLQRYDLPDLTMAETGVRTDSAGGGLVVSADGDVVLVDERGDAVTCVPADGAAPTATPAGDVSGVIADLGDGRALFATEAGIAARTVTCRP